MSRTWVLWESNPVRWFDYIFFSLLFRYRNWLSFAEDPIHNFHFESLFRFLSQFNIPSLNVLSISCLFKKTKKFCGCQRMPVAEQNRTKQNRLDVNHSFSSSSFLSTFHLFSFMLPFRNEPKFNPKLISDRHLIITQQWTKHQTLVAVCELIFCSICFHSEPI